MKAFPMRPAGSPESSTGEGLSVGAIAHELNSLLDGSMRNLRLAERAVESIPSGDAEPIRAVRARLRVAESAMQDMARVLARLLAGARMGGQVLWSSRPLARELDHLLAALAPSAQKQGVRLTATVEPALAEVPAGVLGPVLMNALRNAIESCADAPDADRRVEVTVRAADGDLVIVSVHDSGAGLPEPGHPPRGHGLGLSTCRQLVGEIGGRLELRPDAGGRGAVLEVRVPRRSLVGDG